jgi:hypothetical protein
MSTVSIFKPHDFDATQFVYSAVKPNQYGGKTSYINFDKHTVKIETPKMLVPFGIGTYPPNDPNPTSYNIQLQFPKDLSGKVGKFRENLEKLDNMTMMTAQERSKDWFGKPSLTESAAREYYSPLLIKHLDDEGKPTGKYPDSIRLKLTLNKDGNFSTKCFDHLKQRANIKDIVQKGCYIKAIIELNGVNLKKNAYSLSCKALQIQVYPPMKLTGYAFLPDEDDDEIVDASSLVDVNNNVNDVNDDNEGDGIISEVTVQAEVIDDNGDGDRGNANEEEATADEETSRSESNPEVSEPVVETTEKNVESNETVAHNSDEEPQPSPPAKKKTKFSRKK